LKTKSILALVGVVTVSLACSSGDNNASDGGTNDGTTNNDSSNPNDSGNPGDSGNPDSSTPSKPNYGSVFLSETAFGNSDTYTGSAGFYAIGDGGSGPSSGCAGTQSGSCCYLPPASADAGTGPTPTAVSAGAITIKDGTTSIGTLTPNGTTYTAVTNPPTTAFTWVPGDTLAISAAGDTVAAFSGSVTAVDLFAGVNPTLSEITATNINRSSDFTISWTAKTGSIVVSLSATKGLSTPDGSISCTAASDTGTMTVPAALLGNFTANDGGQISLTRESTDDASNATATITLYAETSSAGKVSFN
jgi:hypothetical protein